MSHEYFRIQQREFNGQYGWMQTVKFSKILQTQNKNQNINCGVFQFS